MSISEFFEKLGAPLNNRMWSWGGVDHESRRVFVRAWEDQITRSKQSASSLIRLAHHSHYAANPTNLGYAERTRHLDLLRKGYSGFVVLCRVKDPAARPRSIAGYNSDRVLELDGLEVVDGDEFGVIIGSRDASDFLTTRPSPRT